MRWRVALVFSLALGCGAERGADVVAPGAAPVSSMQLLALNPQLAEESAAPRAGGDVFHAYSVLGRARIVEPAEQDALLRALGDAERASDGTAAKCFFPRHGLSVQRGSASVDYVICFECLQMKEVRGAQERTVLISRATEPEFDAALKRHGLTKPAD